MRQYLETARCNEIHYQIPEVVFYFVQGVTEPLANLLKKNNISVKVKSKKIFVETLFFLLHQGQIVEVNEDVEKRLQIVDDFSSSESENDENSDENDDDHHDDEENEENEPLTNDFSQLSASATNQPTKINLDVSTLICLVSELTHGGHIYRYPKRWLEIPAELERASHLVPKLENYMKGKENETNVKHFDRSFLRKRIVRLSNGS